MSGYIGSNEREGWFTAFVVICLGISLAFVSHLGASQTSEVLPSEIDEISLKQTDMRDTVVLVSTDYGSGSGTIINKELTDEDGIFKYVVLTNSHVTLTRLATSLIGVNFITGRWKTQAIDNGCSVIAFNHDDNSHREYDTEILVENVPYDISVIAFWSEEELAVANVATDKMLDDIRVFDDVFAVGCQLGMSPTPTVGIISKILTGDNGEKQWIIYSNTAQIIYGSSGGGLFRKYDNHYYLIGVPFRASMTYSGQVITHLAQAISISTARDFIDQSMVTCP